MLKCLFAAPIVFWASAAPAEGDLSRAIPQEIVIEMGKQDLTHMYFKPNNISLETGKAYKLVFKNTDNEKHEFSSPEGVARIFTRKVQTLGPDGKMISEIKGSISEIEVAGGGVAEWFIVPVQTGEKNPDFVRAGRSRGSGHGRNVYH